MEDREGTEVEILEDCRLSIHLTSIATVFIQPTSTCPGMASPTVPWGGPPYISHNQENTPIDTPTG